MNEKNLFATLSNYLISNEYIHSFFIILEYFCFILPSCLYSTLKIKHLNSTLAEFLQNNSYVNKINFINYYHFYIPREGHITILTILIAILLSFIIILVTGLSKHRNAFIPQKILVTLIDIVLFRYFSIFTMSYFSDLIIALLFKNNLKWDIVSTISMIAYLIYLILGFEYIKTNIVFLNISNSSLVDNPTQHIYPYDNLSAYYDINVFFLKIMITMEYNYLNYTLTINYITITFNSIIIILSVLLFVQFSLGHFAVYFHVSSFYANIKQNYIRNSIAVFNSVLCLLSLLLIEDIDHLANIILLFFVSFNISLGIIYIEHHDIINTTLRTQALSYEVIVLMMINDIKAKSIMFDYKILQDAVYTNHKKECNKTECPLKNIYSDNYDQNITAFYKYLNKSKDIHTPFKDITKLFYYKLNHKSFKFFKYYYSLISKYKITNEKYLIQIKHLVDLLIFKENSQQFVFLDNFVENSLLEKNIEKLLEDMNTFFNASIEIKKPETVIQLSCSLKEVINKFAKIYKQNNQVSNSINLSNEADNKVISSVLTYNMMIIQFILENLINHSFIELPPFKIDQSEDYFNIHYNSDNVLICSKDLLSISRQDIKILKVTGELSRINKKHHKYLNELFPNCIEQVGIDLFNNKLKLNNNQQKAFSFPIIFKSISFNITYTFSVIEHLERNIFLTYGQYAKEKKSFVLIDFSDPTKIELLSFSGEILELLKIRKKWIKYLIEKNTRFYLNHLFKHCSIIGEDRQFIKCEFEGKFFLQTAHYLIDKLKKENTIIAEPKKFKQTIENNSTGIPLTFEKKVQYTESIYLYSVYSNSKKIIVNSYHDHNDKTKENANEYFYDTAMFANYQSTNSMSNGSNSSISYVNSSSYATAGNSIDILIKKKIKTEARHLTNYSIMMISLNIIIIVICVVYLVIHIFQIKELEKMNDFYFKFMNICNCMAGQTISLVSSICFAEDPNQVGYCENTMYAFQKYFKELHNITDDDIDLPIYLKNEIFFKCSKCLNTFSVFKTFLFSDNTNFNNILQKTLQSFDFTESSNDELNFTSRNISIEEGLKLFFNTMLFLTNEVTPYIEIPIYFVTYDKGSYSFKNIPNNQLSKIQKEIYKAVFNFLHFYALATQVEEETRATITTVSNDIYNVLFAILIIIGFLNLVLGFLCRELLSKAYYLFKVLIFNIMSQFEKNKEFANYITTKINIFVVLIKLYQKNPNELIRKIQKSQTIYTKQNKTKAEYNAKLAIPENKEIKKNKKEISFGIQFYSFLFRKLVLTLLLIFVSFFFLLISFDNVLSKNYKNNVKVCVFGALQFNFEIKMYSIFVLNALSKIGNFTDDNLAYAFQVKTGSDGMLNELIHRAFRENNKIVNYKKENPVIYPSLTDQIPYECDEMFYIINDQYLVGVSQRLDYDYNLFASYVCEEFNILSLYNFQYLINDVLLRNQLLVNRKSGNDYSSLYSYMNSFKYRELSLLYIFSFRPTFSYYRWEILLPVVSINFNNYIVLVLSLFCLIIVLETLLFCIVKWLLINKITIIQNDLFLFNNCLTQGLAI